MVSMMRERNPKAYEIFVNLKTNQPEESSFMVFFSKMVLRLSSMVVALFLPVLGICMYVLMRNQNPKEAKYPGLATLAAAAIYLSFFTFMIVTYTTYGRPPSWQFLGPLLPGFSSDFFVAFPLN